MNRQQNSCGVLQWPKNKEKFGCWSVSGRERRADMGGSKTTNLFKRSFIEKNAALLVAESDPGQKDLMVRLILNLLFTEHRHDGDADSNGWQSN
jgi:hypothetical protein